ncbi:MAG: hypothetical protein V1494_03255 [Candidatus Diapherotrites archaeon]
MKINFSETFSILAIIYFALILLASFGLLEKYVLHFELFGVVVGVIGAISLMQAKPAPFASKGLLPKENKGKTLHLILFASIAIILATRLAPFISNSIPLGYDPGIYKYAFESYAAGLPNLPFQALDLWLKHWEPQGFFVLTDILFVFGFTIEQIITSFFIFAELLLGLVIYAVAKNFFGKKEAAIAIFLYAISIIEFKVFWYFYLKNVIGLILLLTALYLYSKKKHLACALVAGFLAGVHRPTFLVFTIIFGLNFLIDLKNIKKNLATGIAIALICIGFYFGKFDELLFGVLVPAIESPGAGTFMDFFQYQFSILIYLPFAVIGGIKLFESKERRVLLIGAIICLFIAAFQLIFYNRFLIFLEVFVLLLAAHGISLFISSNAKALVKAAIIGILVVSGVFLIAGEALNAKPLIGESELNSIKLIGSVTESNALILTTSSYYSPWLKGYAGRTIIAPGLFDEDKWNKEKWERFWGTSDENTFNQMLSEYGKPIYVFISSKSFGNNQKFENNCFEKTPLNEKDALYKFVCG